MKIYKSIVLVISTVILFLIISSANSMAAESIISLSGDGEVESGTTQTILVKVKNDDAVGVIQGKIAGDSNIEIVNVEAIDNNWVVNYNSATKQFNAYYADGVTDGEVLAIKYKLKEGMAIGTVTLSEIKLTTITYVPIENYDVEKTIVGKQSSNNGSGNQSSSSSGSSESSSSTGETTSKQKKSANGIIPQLGQSGKIIIAIVVATLLTVISYRRLKNRE